MRLGERRIRIKRTDPDAFIVSASSSGDRTHPEGAHVTNQTSDAWETFDSALAQAHALLAEQDRRKLVAALESLAKAAKQLAGVLGD